MSQAWASIPWASVDSPDQEHVQPSTIGWYKQNVPYVSDGTYLQTLDIWVPTSEVGDQNSPPATYLPNSGSAPWLVYIHGGAWRDPLVSSSSFGLTARTILQGISRDTGRLRLSGMVSINYRLSAHPNHPTDPSPSPEKGEDPARRSRHPQHICDVLTALHYLQELGIANEYVLSGHSCGATLAFQVAMDSSRWGWDSTATPVRKPRVLVGLNGLYDLAAFIRNPNSSHQALVKVYDAFTRGAFGDDAKIWEAVCPTIVEDWKTEWPEGRKIVLVQSREDSLVPYSQLEIMRDQLLHSGGDEIDFLEIPATRDHNKLWAEGDELADILKRAILEWL